MTPVGNQSRGPMKKEKEMGFLRLKNMNRLGQWRWRPNIVVECTSNLWETFMTYLNAGRSGGKASAIQRTESQYWSSSMDSVWSSSRIYLFMCSGWNTPIAVLCVHSGTVIYGSPPGISPIIRSRNCESRRSRSCVSRGFSREILGI
jgi:hypothetical protein